MVDDATLAREAQLVYSNTLGFAPAGNTLDTWEGTVRGGGREFRFQIFLPDYFPNVAPVVRAIDPIKHRNVDNEGFVNLRILDSWRAEFHLYQVINALRGLMARAPPIPAEVQLPTPKQMPLPEITRTPTSPAESAGAEERHEYQTLRTELNRLKDQMTTRDEEIARLRARQASGIPSAEPSEAASSKMSVDIRTELESERIATSEMLAHLHERFDSGEISVHDFSRLLKKYQKDLHILEKKIAYLDSQGR
ncbi:MAG: ubiquitin-conjugating enzyme E2 variant [Candidatus Hodarchaeota archaeon]